MENRIIQNNKILIQELCNEHNKLRKNPESYIGILKKVLNLIRRSNILHLKSERPFKTIEGKEAVLEAINYLSNIPKSLIEKLSNQTLKISEDLCKASSDHAKDIGINGTCSHIGSDNCHMDTRVEKYCDWFGGLAESLDFGILNPQNIMIKLLICDGDKKRSQRRHIFDPGFTYFGAGFYQHIKYKRCSVISYAGFIQPRDADFSEKELIQNYLYLHRYFVNKNKDEIENLIYKKNLEKEEIKEIGINKEEDIKSQKEEKEKPTEDIKKNENKKEEEKKEVKKEVKKEEEKKEEKKEEEKKEEKKEEKINDKKEIEKSNEKNEENTNNKDNEKIEESNDSNNLIIIEETENENEKEEHNKFDIINKRKITKYGVEIKETVYRLKEGNYHIVEEETKHNILNFLNLF